MGHVLSRFDRIGPSSGMRVVEYASMSFLVTFLNLNQFSQKQHCKPNRTQVLDAFEMIEWLAAGLAAPNCLAGS